MNLHGTNNFNDSGEFCVANLNSFLDGEDIEDRLLAASAATGMVPRLPTNPSTTSFIKPDEK